MNGGGRETLNGVLGEVERLGEVEKVRGWGVTVGGRRSVLKSSFPGMFG